MDLTLPSSLIPEAIRAQRPITVDGEYFVAITAGRTLDLSLPKPPPNAEKKRFSLKHIFDGQYLASEKKTAMWEVWQAQNQSLHVDLYSARVLVGGVFDLRPSEIEASLELSKDCFRLANPPDRQHRVYAAWQHLAYVIWSAGFNGVIWKSARYGGNSLCVYRLASASYIGDPQPVGFGIEVQDQLNRDS